MSGRGRIDLCPEGGCEGQSHSKLGKRGAGVDEEALSLAVDAAREGP